MRPAGICGPALSDLRILLRSASVPGGEELARDVATVAHCYAWRENQTAITGVIDMNNRPLKIVLLCVWGLFVLCGLMLYGVMSGKIHL